MLGVLIFFLCYALIFINIAGSITVLALNLVLGPVFFALAFDRDFRGHSQRWFAAVLSYILLMPLYGAALRMAASIAGAAIPAPFGLPSVPQVAHPGHRSDPVGRDRVFNEQGSSMPSSAERPARELARRRSALPALAPT